MPTGTGKSGIIAVLSKCFDSPSHVLVLSPWAALREQLARDIAYRFWQKLKVDTPSWNRPERQFLPSNVDACLEESRHDPAVLLCTIQTLQALYRDEHPAFKRLQRLISLVIVDEGHREPAPEWAEAVRSLNLPIVLFTATPYRNDHRLFHVDDRHVYHFSHQEAVDQEFIRRVTFHESEYGKSCHGFVDKLLEYYYGEFQKIKPSDVADPRVIIRCETGAEVSHMAKILKHRGQSVLAIHEQFGESEEEDYLRKSIPDPENTDATFWIHQFKLIEGIDDPRFCLLAVYRPLHNARALVQQIGRIVRNPNRASNQMAYVFSDPSDRQQAFWAGYLRYEWIYSHNPDKYEPRQLIDTMIGIQPEYLYFEGNYRERLDLGNLPDEFHKILAYPRSANVYRIEKGFNWCDLSEDLMRQWSEVDRDVRKSVQPGRDSLVLLYHAYNNTPLLTSHALMEFTIGYTVCHRHGRYLFYYDTGGMNSDYLAEYAERVPPATLERLFRGKEGRIGQISLVNSDLGRHSIRRRDVRAYSIAETAPGLGDHAHFFSTASGSTQEQEGGYVRRYVGFTRSRVTDASTLAWNYEEYLAWLKSIADALDDLGTQPPDVFKRFARYTAPPGDPTPVNILLDLDEVEHDFVTVEGNGNSKALLIEDKCCDIIGGSFTLHTDTGQYQVGVTYDAARRRYTLKSPLLEQSYQRSNQQSNTKTEGLVTYLNREQAFRIIPCTRDVIYAHAQFYEPRLSIVGRGRNAHFDLLNLFHPSNSLESVTTEKGRAACTDGSGWEPGSLFHFIDNLGRPGGLEPDLHSMDLLICDDMGTEMADFIATSTEDLRVILIHGKVSHRETKRSASAFHEVCSQVTKNLVWLQPFLGREAPNIRKWGNAWRSSGIEGKVHERIRRWRGEGAGSGRAAWQAIQEIIRNPSAIREVWIVLGRGFSYSEFERERARRDPSPEIVQIFFLLQSTWSAVSSIGANLRIYCSP